ncbi:MAG: hypothetical protein B6247_20120 [Candidatus Parabeggiatoa sp. nov. 2]|nr:MAG: hypothetical protein B6247_20120 [Beggiatoa sp. 4572_84]
MPKDGQIISFVNNRLYKITDWVTFEWCLNNTNQRILAKSPYNKTLTPLPDKTNGPNLTYLKAK